MTNPSPQPPGKRLRIDPRLGLAEQFGAHMSPRRRWEEERGSAQAAAFVLVLVGLVLALIALAVLHLSAWLTIALLAASAACFWGAAHYAREAQAALVMLRRLPPGSGHAAEQLAPSASEGARTGDADADAYADAGGYGDPFQPEDDRGDDADFGRQSGAATDAERVEQARIAYESGRLPAFRSPSALHPGERCVYVAPCAEPDARAGPAALDRGYLVITDRACIVQSPISARVLPLHQLTRARIRPGAAGYGVDCLELSLATRRAPLDLVVAYPLEAMAYLLIAFKMAGITPPRSSERADAND